MQIIKRNIPNTITCCNLFSGCIATVMAFEKNYLLAIAFIVLGAVFDFFDGMVARMLKVSSPMGVEMDSMADDITFGLAPSVMVFALMQDLMYPTFFQSYLTLIPYLAFLLAVFSAVRLAKFNIDKRQTTSFIGLPTPANALFWSSLVAGYNEYIVDLRAAWILIPGLIFLFSYLLIAEIPMFSLKFKNLSWKDNKTRYIFLLVGIPMLVLGIKAAVPLISWYIFYSIITYNRKVN